MNTHQQPQQITAAPQVTAAQQIPVLQQITELLARQSYAIDSGDGPGWAATFTDDGEFASPSYPAPIRGSTALTDFANAFAPNNPRSHHLVLGTFLTTDESARCTTNSTLIITRSTDSGVEMLRTCTLLDAFANTAAGWRLSRRQVLVH